MISNTCERSSGETRPVRQRAPAINCAMAARPVVLCVSWLVLDVPDEAEKALKTYHAVVEAGEVVVEV